MVSAQNFSTTFFSNSKLGRNSGCSVFFVQPLLRSKAKTKRKETQTVTNHYTGFKRSWERAAHAQHQAPSKQTPVHTFRRYATVRGLKITLKQDWFLQIQRKQNKYAIVSKKKTGNHNKCTRFCTFEANGENRNCRIISLLKFNYDRKKKAETSHPTSWDNLC